MSSLSDKNREKAEERILKTVTIKCKKCHGNMIRVESLPMRISDDAIVGYSCEDCPHYYLFD